MTVARLDSRITSRWSTTGGALFVCAAAGFVLLWSARASSGIDQLIQHGVAVVAFLGLWTLGAVSLAIGALRARRRGMRPLPRLPLCVASAAGVIWLGAMRATPERMIRAAARGDADVVAHCLRRGIDPSRAARTSSGPILAGGRRSIARSRAATRASCARCSTAARHSGPRAPHPVASARRRSPACYRPERTAPPIRSRRCSHSSSNTARTRASRAWCGERCG